MGRPRASPAEPTKVPADMKQPKFSEGEAPPIDWRNWTNLIAYTLSTAVTYTSLSGSLAANAGTSKRYQTLLTPAGWDFGIWGPIFVWQGIFVVAQMLPHFRDSDIVFQITPWWWALCVCQIAWTVAFARNAGILAVFFMLGIFGSLLGTAWSTDGLQLTKAEKFLLPPYCGPLYLQFGWIVVAIALNVSAHASAARSPHETLLALAVVSNAAVLIAVAIFTFDMRRPDPLVGVVVASTLAAIISETGIPWSGLRSAGLITSVVISALAVFAMISRVADEYSRSKF